MGTAVGRLGLGVLLAASLAACGEAQAPASSVAPSASATASSAPAPTASGYPASVLVGVSMPLSGADATGGGDIRNGVLLAMAQLNAKGGIAGKIRIDHWIRDEANGASDLSDPQVAGLNMTQYLADPNLMAVVGGHSSDAAKAMLVAQMKNPKPAVLVSPSATAPELTDPQRASEYRPDNKPFFFRTVTTDVYQGPAMANYAAAQGVKTVYVLSDSDSISGKSAADLFTQRAQEKGIKVLGHSVLDSALLDYSAVVADVQTANPQGLYYDGNPSPWLKLAKQVLGQPWPRTLMAGDGIYSVDLPSRAGVAGDGWLLTYPGRYTVDQPRAAGWQAAYTAMFHAPPSTDYAVAGYMAMEALADSMDRIVKDGAPLTRENVEAYMLRTKLATIQGPIVFDENGDLTDHQVSIVQMAGSRFRYKDLAPTS